MSRSNKISWTEAYARDVLGQMEQEGKTLSEMARKLRVSPQRISWWKKRLGRQTPEKSAAKQMFVEVTMPAQNTERAFTIRTRRGHAVEVWPGFDAGELHRVLAVVEEATC